MKFNFCNYNNCYAYGNLGEPIFNNISLRREVICSPVWGKSCNVKFYNIPHVNVGYKYYEGDFVTLCNIPHVNVGYKYYEGDVVTLCKVQHVNVRYKYYF